MPQWETNIRCLRRPAICLLRIWEDRFRRFMVAPPSRVANIRTADRNRHDTPFTARLSQQPEEVVVVKILFAFEDRASQVRCLAGRGLRRTADERPSALNIKIIDNENDLLFEILFDGNAQRI